MPRADSVFSTQRQRTPEFQSRQAAIAPGWQDAVLRLATALERLCDLTQSLRIQPMDSPTLRDLVEEIIEGLILIVDATEDDDDYEDEDEHLNVVPARSDWRLA